MNADPAPSLDLRIESETNMLRLESPREHVFLADARDYATIRPLTV
jgi:hypothetical protein